MLLRMLPEQVARYWDSIKTNIETALPPIAGDNKERLNNILASILAGRIVCWFSFRKLEDNKIQPTGLVTTQVIVDEATLTKSLLIYTLHSPDDSLGEDGWREGYEALKEYGRSVGCDRVTAYSDDPRIIAMTERFGGNADYRFISVPI